MSGGFFGSYFRRKHKDDARAGAQEEPTPAPQASGDPSARAGTEQASAPVSEETGAIAASGAAQARAAAGGEGSEEAETSPLDALMQDRIVVALMQDDIVTIPQALTALRQQQRQPEAALWRFLAQIPDVDRNAVFATAARVHGFEMAHLSEKRPTDELVEAVHGLFPPHVAKEMSRLGLLPYEFVVDPQAKRHSLVLATHDPSHPEVAGFVERLRLHVELRYAAASTVAERLRRAQEKMQAAAEGKARPEVPAQAAVRTQAHTEAAERPAESAHELDLTAGAEPPRPGAPFLSEGLSTEDLLRQLSLDMQPEQDVLIEERIDPARPDLLSGDGYADVDAPTGRFGADETDREEPYPERPWAAGEEPLANVSNWSGNDGAAEPPAEPAAASAEKKPEPANLDAVKSKDRVVAMLLRQEMVTPQQVQDAQLRQKKEGSKDALWRILAQVSGVDREKVFAEAARVYAFPIARLGEGRPDIEFARSVVETFSEDRRTELFKLRVLPFECDLEHQTGAIKLVFITHDPTRPEVHRLMQQLKLERFELRYAPEAVILAAMAEVFPRRNEFLERMNDDSLAFDLGASYEEKTRLIDEDALEAEISRSSLINLFEATLVEAVRQGASDIHIYPNAQKKIEIHFRIDGRLSNWHTEDKVHPEALLAVIKDNATNVDRFERDAAQDGFIQRWIDEALIRFRVSVLPIANASQELRSESIVIRVLDDRKVLTDLRKLGLLDASLKRFEAAIRQPHGMVILTGPTGSGKSTTLVAALHQVVTPEVNVLTVEDPVEYIIPGVRQIKLNTKLGLEDALRSILRHDPDVVMVGEMRDRQTAELAIKLANTGHLTFSTLHTNDAPAAVSRLYKMGVEPFLIAYAINLVVAQRLIRVLCPECKELDDDPDPIMLKKLGFSEEELETTEIYRPGCNDHCKTCRGVGYKGRRAITEALYFSRAIRHLIVEADKAIDEDAIRQQAVKEGMLTLADSARVLVKMGETSVVEMVRVVTTDT